MLALIGTGLLALSHWTDLDILLADHAFDWTRGVFPWRDAWFAAVFLHVWIKVALVSAGVVVVGLTLADTLLRPSWMPAGLRPRLRIVALCALAIPFTVGAIRGQALSHCPWDLERYGGAAPYVRLLEASPTGTSPGHCFPAAHATSALWLAAFAVVWVPHRMRIAWLVLALGIGAGLGLGWVQQLRGAHFLTHTLWSAWIACALVLLITRLVLGHHAAGARDNGAVAAVPEPAPLQEEAADSLSA